jgi:uncharacterized protein (TIGR02996 family)
MSDIERSFLASISETPENLTARLVYADWLAERGDPRAEYLRLHNEFLQTGYQSPRHEALALASALDDLEWLRFIELHDVLHRVTRRCGGRLPAALSMLWRESVWMSDPRQQEDDYYPDLDKVGATTEVLLFLECVDMTSFYLEKNPEIRDAFLAMFSQIEFVGWERDNNLAFGLWRYTNGVSPMAAPIVTLDIECNFALVAGTLQDHFAATHDPQEFAEARTWFAERGIATSPTWEEAEKLIKGLPDPQERFARYCRGEMDGAAT